MASTPPPPPAPTNTSLTNLQYSESFAGKAAVVSYTAAGGSGSSTINSNSLGAAQVRYDAATQSYTLLGTPLTQVTFAPADKSATQAPDSVTYLKGTSPNQTVLSLFKPGSANATLALTYASYGAFAKTQQNGNSLDADAAFFVYGVRTAAADLPKSGTATYQTFLDGGFSGTPGIYVVSGSSSFSVDFGASSFTFQAAPTGINVITGTSKSFGTQTVSGSIASDASFDGTSAANGGYTTALSGQFYGPAAAELGAAFTLTGADGVGNGIVVGRKN